MSAVPLEDEDLVAFGDGRGYGTRAGNGMGNGDVAAERECDIDPETGCSSAAKSGRQAPRGGGVWTSTSPLLRLWPS